MIILKTHNQNTEQVIKPLEFIPATGELNKQTRKYKPVIFILTSLFIFGLGIIFYLFVAKSVLISTTPHSDNIHISGGLHFKITDHLLMLSGTYNIDAKLPGYYPLNKKFTVSPEQNQTQHFNFVKLPGNLSVSVEPKTPIQAFIDDKAVAINNEGIIENIAAGQHKLTIKSSEHFDYHQKINIEGMSKKQNINIKLVPAWALIKIDSNPTGASIYNNGKLLAQTPSELKLVEGEYQLALNKSGYQSAKKTINVVASIPQTFAPINLTKITGELSVNSDPEGVSVTFGDTYLGTTPLQAKVLPDLKKKLLLFKDGYHEESISLLVPSGQSMSQFIKLKPILGQISFNVKPEGALLYVNNVLMGKPDKTLTLPALQQKIRIEKQGFVSYIANVLPHPDLSKHISVELKTQEQERLDKLKPEITAASGTKLKLFKPESTFVTGASRREQGRRANEVKRTINLSKPFYLSVTEITNKQFKQFSKHHSSGHIKGNSLNGNHQPVVQITWLQAVQYCNWLSEKEKLTPVYTIEDSKVIAFDNTATGYRLPTEAEWVWAARFNKNQMLKYSWGNALPPIKDSGNFADISGAAILGNVQTAYNDTYIASSPVASFKMNEKGLFDISGNVAEWIHDYYEIKTGLSMQVEKDPMGAISGDYHVIRGSSWAHGTRTELRLSYRDYGNEKRNDLGFRIARYAQ